MFHQILKTSLISLFIFASFIFSQTENDLITELRNEYEKLDNLHNSSNKLAKSNKNQITEIKSHIKQLKKKLKLVNTNLEQPIYFDNNIFLDQNVDLLDFNVYEYTTDYYQVFARLKNKQNNYLDWVKLRYNFYSNKTFIGTDYTYIDFETYGYSGISPYKYSFIETFIDKVDFDSIAYQIEYDVETGEDDVLWDQILTLQSVVIQPSSGYYKWQGIVKNSYNYSVKFPKIFACILKDNKMIALDYTYLDVQNDSLPPNSEGIFDSYIDLPSSYDEIKYYITYSLYSLNGSGNLPPNIPIFPNSVYSGFTRTETELKVFIIDPDDDRCDLLVDYGDGVEPNWQSNLVSGVEAMVQNSYKSDGQYIARAKVKERNNPESEWSDPIIVNISSSTSPQIINAKLNSAQFKKNYTGQLQASGGIKPYQWKVIAGSLPNDLILNSSTGQITGYPKASGLFNFTITLIDAGIPSVSDTSSFSINVFNNSPVITSDDTLIAFTNSEITYNASANDPDENLITFDFFNYPAWLSKTNRTLHGITPDTSSEASFRLIATDGELSDTLNVIIIVKEQTFINNQNGSSYCYTLFPNYPNPFNPYTMIKVSVPKLAEAMVNIYDINGRLVNTVYNGWLKPGFHEFEWKADKIPSGTYFIKFQSADFSQIIKCSLIK
jgi:hypothetical protein